VGLLDAPVAPVEIRQVSTYANSTVVEAGQSNPDADFRFNPTLGGSGVYIFSLKTTRRRQPPLYGSGADSSRDPGPPYVRGAVQPRRSR